jgi:hypothetical protein
MMKSKVTGQLGLDLSVNRRLNLVSAQRGGFMPGVDIKKLAPRALIIPAMMAKVADRTKRQETGLSASWDFLTHHNH